MSTESVEAAAEAPEPRANPDLLGHEQAEETLIGAARSGRLHHAWLLAGPKGIGKATLAHRFARWLLFGHAEEGGQAGLFGGEPEPPRGLWTDPDDPLFHRIAAGGHADLMTLQREFDERAKRLRTEIVAPAVRKVAGFLALTAAEGGWRVVIVDGAEDMNRHAANALLKTLEEPPARTVLLLVSHAPGRLLPTIRSRCRKLALKPLDAGTVTALLGRYRPGLDDGDAAQLAALGEGSIGRALELHDAGGLALYHEMLSLIATLPGTDAVRLHGIADAVSRTRAESGAHAAFDVFAELLRWWIARLIRARASGALPPELAPGEGEIMARLATTGSLDQWIEVWEKITRLFARAGSVNLDRKQVLLNAFFALARAAS
jgi:DNA polymerase-3 subunit delta'